MGVFSNPLLTGDLEPVDEHKEQKQIRDIPRIGYTVKLCYNDHGYNEVTAIAKKCCLQVTFTSIEVQTFHVYNEHASRIYRTNLVR
jgi:hypothetical protein